MAQDKLFKNKVLDTLQIYLPRRTHVLMLLYIQERKGKEKGQERENERKRGRDGDKARKGVMK